MNNFKLIAVRILSGCKESYVKCLKEGIFYYLNNDFVIVDDGETITRRSAYIDPLDDKFFCLNENCNLGINLSAIVGKNGDGKSSLIEIIIRLLNNFSKQYGFDPTDSLYFISGLRAEIYYSLNGCFYRLREDGDQNDEDRVLLHMYEESKGGWTIKSHCVSSEKIDKSLFYTLISNYSHYAYNTDEIDNETNKIRPDDHWLHNVFHKNDGYQTLLSIHPLRSRGNIDMNREKFLSKQRILATWLRSSINENDNGAKSDSMSFNGKKAVELRLTDIQYSKLQEVTFRDFFERNRRMSLLEKAIEAVKNFTKEYNKGSVSSFTEKALKAVLDALEKSAKKYFRANGVSRNLTLFQVARDWITEEGLDDKQSDIMQLLSALDDVPDQYIEGNISKALEMWKHFSSLSLIQIQRIELVDYICDIWREFGIRDADGNIIKIDVRPEIVFKPYSTLSEEEKCLHYIIYKTISIFETYPVYDNLCRKYSEVPLFFDGERPDFKMFGDEITGRMIPSPFIQLSNDWSCKTHTTLKLRQTYNYYKTSGSNTRIVYKSDKFKNTKNADCVSIEFAKLSNEDKKIISQIENMPPAIFYWDIYFETREKNLVGLDTFSSGEKQKLYTLSAIVYHLQNLDSVSDNVRRYEAVNIILEEIELYFHPEWQRTYCYDLMDLIYKSGLQNIKAINILFVTHSPYLLSDIPKTNVLFIKDGVPSYSMQENTFGSNINGLLKNGFFLPSLPMGEFAHQKINSMFAKLHSADFPHDEETLINIYQDIIRVGEPAIRHQLMMLYKVFK